MNYKMIGRINALILYIAAIFMLPALLISLFCRESRAAGAFGVSMLVTAAAASLLMLLCGKAQKRFYAREGLVCVGLCWIVISLFGALPLYLSGEFPAYIDALFEITSGFTTTGASVCLNVEELSRGVLYWRSFSHWLGGMGVLVFVLAIIPINGKTDGFSVHLLRAESPGPDTSKLVPRMRQTAAISYLIYIVLTVLDVVVLCIGGMPFFDALCTAFGTAGTGGFGTRADSIASFNPFIQNTCTVFMLLFGVNFTCYFLALRRQFKAVLFDEELRFYLGEFALATILFSVLIYRTYPTLGEAIRHSAFTTSSIMTTTGFVTADFDKWPTLAKAALLLLMLGGACAGSTGGGIKARRSLILIKSLRRNVHQYLHPNRVQSIRVNGKPLDETVVRNTNIFFTAYILIIAASFLVISADRFSLTTSFASVMACINNIGPGLEVCGPIGNYAAFSVVSKVVLILDMLIGRLEIFPILVLFSRSTWKRL